MRRRVNALLDRVVRREIVLAGRALDAYLLSVYTGVLVGTAVIFALSARSSVSLPVMTVLVALVAAFSLLLFKSTKLVGRSYPLLNWAKKGVYHFQIAALVLTTAVLRLVTEPVLPYLDVLVVGMIVYQAFGRIGCFLAGCCHGRPSTWGVRYGKEHAKTGYVYFVRGVRLFPVQLLEALWLVVLAAGALAIVLRSHEPGDAVTWYVVGYAAGRFTVEFLRGDAARIVIKGFSEPQWTALLLTGVVTALEAAGALALHWWHVAVFLAMASVVATRTLLRRSRGVLHPEAAQARSTEEQVLLDAGLVPLGPPHAIYVPRRRSSA
jgi:prolipoprotein diacylglyceryltransferase